jgi:hypothetical protein
MMANMGLIGKSADYRMYQLDHRMVFTIRSSYGRRDSNSRRTESVSDMGTACSNIGEGAACRSGC